LFSTVPNQHIHSRTTILR